MFAREGAKVVIGDVLEAEGRKVEAEINEAGGECLFIHLDVTQEADMAPRGGSCSGPLWQARYLGQ